MELDLAQLGVQTGGSTVIGAVIGYAAKKVIKLFAVLAGLQFGFLTYLEQQGLIIVDWSTLGEMAVFSSGDGGGGLPPVVANLLSAVPMTGGLALGAVIGFRRG